MNVKKSIELLGLRVKDKVTGTTGVVTSISFDLYGCVQALVDPPTKADGERVANRWYDTNRLTITSKKRAMELPSLDFTKEKGPAYKPTK